jgi:hypothetical protein
MESGARKRPRANSFETGPSGRDPNLNRGRQEASLAAGETGTCQIGDEAVPPPHSGLGCEAAAAATAVEAATKPWTTMRTRQPMIISRKFYAIAYFCVSMSAFFLPCVGSYRYIREI